MGATRKLEEAVRRRDTASLAKTLKADLPSAKDLLPALNLAISDNFTDGVKILVESRPDTVKEVGPESPILVAARSGSAKGIVDILVGAGGNVNVKEPGTGKTPLIVAAAGGFADTAEALLSYPECDRNAKGDPPKNVRRLDDFHTGLTALFEAIMIGNKGAPVVEALLRRGADATIVAYTELDGAITPLMTAAMFGLTGIVEMLIKAGVEVDAKDKSEHTALHWAVKGANLEKHTETDVIKPLIAAGAQLNAISNSGGDHITPVLRACDIGDYRGPVAHDMAKILIEAGSDLSRRDMYGKTILHRALSYGWLDIVDLVLDQGIDISVVDYSGHSAIYDVIDTYNINMEAFKRLLDRNPGVADKYTYTAQCNIRIPNSTLMDVAMQAGSIAVLPFLVAAGCPFPKNLEEYKDRVTMDCETSKWIVEAASQPRSLKDWCRIGVRRALPTGCQLESVLNQLAVPSELADYVLLRKGVDTCSIPQIS